MREFGECGKAEEPHMLRKIASAKAQEAQAYAVAECETGRGECRTKVGAQEKPGPTQEGEKRHDAWEPN